MRVLVCGGRDFKDWDLLFEHLGKYPISFIISGGAKGADTLALYYASIKRLPSRIFVARWEADGKAAGPIRNQRMLDEGKPDMVIAFWDGKSKGTKDMVDRAKKANIETRIINY